MNSGLVDISRCMRFADAMRDKANGYDVVLEEAASHQMNRCVIDIRNNPASRKTWYFARGSVMYSPLEGFIEGEIPTLYDSREAAAERIRRCRGFVTEIHSDAGLNLAHVHFYSEDPKAILCLRDKLLEEP